MIETFPATMPSVPSNPHGWLSRHTAAMLREHLDANTRVVIEVGSWLGKSTRFILDRAPNATLYCVDTWLGSAEHHKASIEPMLATLFETFVVNCWACRDHIRIVRGISRLGLAELHQAGVAPDLIYVDGAHDSPTVAGDMNQCLDLFPRAVLVGDDWRWHSVRTAVEGVAANRGIVLKNNTDAWCIEGRHLPYDCAGRDPSETLSGMGSGQTDTAATQAGLAAGPFGG